MARRNSMSTARQSRIRTSKRAIDRDGVDTDRDNASALTESPLGITSGDFAVTINIERARLLKAEAVLGCVAFALTYEDWFEDPNRRPSFVDAVVAAQELVRGVLEGLDSVESLLVAVRGSRTGA